MMKRGRSLTILASIAMILSTLSGGSYAQTVYVNDSGTGSYPTIQAAVDALGQGGTVILEPGVYTGDGNRDIDFGGKLVTVRSTAPADPAVVASTVIDVQGTADDPHYGFFLEYQTDASPGVIEGLTIANSVTANPASTGVHCASASVTIRNCVICDMHSYATGVGYYEMGSAVEVQGGDVTIEDCTLTRNVGSGDPDTQGWPILMSKNQYTCGGVDVRSGNATLSRCTLSYNYAWLGGAVFSIGQDDDEVSLLDCQILDNSGHEGGALHCWSGTMELNNCLIAGNVSEANGGAIFNRGSVVAVGCTLADNDAVGAGDALYCVEDGTASVWNCVLWNADDEIIDADGGQSSVNYSCIRGGWGGDGNVSGDPLFIDASAGDYRLMRTSPCIDAASGIAATAIVDSELDILGNRRFDDPKVGNTGSGMARYIDMGAYEFQMPLVYHFWSPVLNRHFYTASASEKDYIIAVYPDAWTYEGADFRVYDSPADSDARTVYRFWSPMLCSHFYTISEEEKDFVIATYPDAWLYEGPVFYAYAPGEQPSGTAPVYRFWSSSLRTHFYTVFEGKKNELIDDKSDTWTYEGIVWYVWRPITVDDWPTTF